MICNLNLMEYMESNGIINGHEYVDLGLPSGLLWATCNVGANNPYEYGNYYAWGETSPKATYDSNYYFGNTVSKDVKSDRYSVLKASDDAASVNWGSIWRIPTKAEFEELKYRCKWEKSEIELIPDKKWGWGYKVIGPNGNSIFLPKAGLINGSVNGGGYDCHYWSSSLHTAFSSSTKPMRRRIAWRLIIDSRGEYPVVINGCFAHYGIPVRPVASRRKSSSTAKTNSNNSNSGCYIATAVYGSYNCPEVWTLRRFRDNTLDETWYGRAFIQTYYAISPTLVKWFGETSWFKVFWRKPLDKLVASLRNKGVKDTPYIDKY